MGVVSFFSKSRRSTRSTDFHMRRKSDVPRFLHYCFFFEEEIQSPEEVEVLFSFLKYAAHSLSCFNGTVLRIAVQ